MRRTRNAKIVATLGPASSDPQVIERLFVAGVDVFRLNFSHGSAADHRARVDALRAIERKHARPIAILADLQGPKLRVGTFTAGAVQLDDGKPRLAVGRCDAERADARVVVGGRLSGRKGGNGPGVVLPISALTEKD